jgi:hypothetical protein
MALAKTLRVTKWAMARATRAIVTNAVAAVTVVLNSGSFLSHIWVIFGKLKLSFDPNFVLIAMKTLSTATCRNYHT